MAVASSLRCTRGLIRHQENKKGFAKKKKKRVGTNHQRHSQFGGISSVAADSKNKRSKTEKNTSQLNDLPVEILFDILSRLPITSLLVAKNTCKLWDSIVNDPVFSLSLKTPPGLLYTLSDGDSNLYFITQGDDTTATKLPGYQLGDQNRYNSFSSCHGLICYRSIPDQSVYVSNPLIADSSIKIPLPNSFYPPLTWGFGYAPLSKKYKYVHFSLVKQPKMRFTAAIFTLGDQSWRQVPVPCDIHRWRSPVYCNGSLYWSLAHLPGHEALHHVMSFDLDTEKVRPRRVFPSDGTTRNLTASCYSTYLTVLGESVAFVIRSTSGLQEVCMLVDEAEDLWVQKYRVSAPTPRSDRVHFTLSGLSMNQELYGMETTTRKVHRPQAGLGSVHHEVTERRCLSFNADRETYAAIQLPFAKDGISPQLLIPHVGSLVSPSKIVSASAKQPFLVAK